MKLLLVSLLAAVLASASADHHTLSLAQKQKAINGLLWKVEEPIRVLIYPKLYEASQNWDPKAHTDHCHDGGVAVERLMGEIHDHRMTEKQHIFSLFNDRQREEAIMLVDVLMNCKDAETFIGNAAYFRDRVNEGEFVYALYVSVTHSDFMKDVVLPPLYEVTPHLFTNAEVIMDAYRSKMVQKPGKFRSDFTGSKSNSEQRVAYFGEDVGVNSHHVHWHMDFPFWWKNRVIDRQGELFFWAHHQLTARFDAERLSNHLSAVDELYWDKPIAEGFAPHTTYRHGGAFPARPDNKEFDDVEGVARVRDMRILEERIYNAIDHGYVIDTQGHQVLLDVEHGINILGDLIESSTSSPNVRYYGSLHNTAHKMLGRQADPTGKYDLTPGVMEHFETATRDPSFFRLHKYMNNIFKHYKDSLPSYTKDELAYPNVEIVSVGVEGELMTFFEDYEFSLISGIDDTEAIDDHPLTTYIPRLNHEEFSFTADVNANADELATIRVFMCPKYDSNGVEYTLEGARWGCIQVDKFWQQLTAGSNHIVRKSSESSVTIPDRTHFEVLIDEANAAVAAGSPMPTHNADACGLPERLLLPKGKTEGMDFELFVSITSGNDAAVSNMDLVMKDGNYGYCGIKGHNYPDKRAMGYPLDRHVEDDRLFRELTNIKWTTVKVFHREQTTA